MSHGHAMRSIFGRARVTHRVGDCQGFVAPPPARHASSPPSRWRALETVLAQRGSRVATDLVAAHAVRDHWSPRLECARERGDVLGRAAQRAGNRRGIGVECGLPPDVEHDRRRKIRETLRKVKGRDCRIDRHSKPPAAGAATKQSLDGAGPAMRRGVCESPDTMLGAARRGCQCATRFRAVPRAAARRLPGPRRHRRCRPTAR